MESRERVEKCISGGKGVYNRAAITMGRRLEHLVHLYLDMKSAPSAISGAAITRCYSRLY